MIWNRFLGAATRGCLVLLTVTFLVSDLAAEEDAIWGSDEPTHFDLEIHHPSIEEVTLFASHPQIVTPVGIAVAPDGRVFVQENHTHKRETNYKGPDKDRILVFEDTDSDGIADKRSVFYEGHTFSTDLLFGPDGHLYVSTRWFIGRFPNAADKATADGDPEKLVVCETDGDYPHNGVGGLAIDPAKPDWLAFGFGENLGADYRFIGSDGTELSGGAEGGSTYRCRTDGSQLERLSTGHWNAFGMAYDLKGNLFSTDNDPNATPPNRLLHVIPGADFGYEYRYGRSGRHPLVCWYGENPGTLGMIGALGEAACGLISYGPGQLLSASWTDNRVDLHGLTPKGESFVASREPFLSGPDDFRPVHFAYSPDRTELYFTDWVKISYPVHGHGRIWRVKLKQPVDLAPRPRGDDGSTLSFDDAMGRLASDDPYAQTRAIASLVSTPDLLDPMGWQHFESATAKASYAVALKRIDNGRGHQGRFIEAIPSLLNDPDSDVRFVGIKWIADEGLDQYRSDLQRTLERGDLRPRDLRSIVAALAAISEGDGKEFSPDQTLLDLAVDPLKPTSLRSLALRNIRADHPGLTVKILGTLVQSDVPSVQREAVRSLALHPKPDRAKVLADVAADDSIDSVTRADAIAGLVDSTGFDDLLQRLTEDADAAVSAEAKRTLVAQGLAQRKLDPKPDVDDLSGWQALVDTAAGQGDVAVGRRLFFHTALGGCYKCHAMNGRGNQIGPDLSTIHRQSDIDRDWLLKHIVNPNAEMAPYYRPQQLLTLDGEILTGLVVGREGQKQAYVGNDGVIFFVDKDDIEERRELMSSIMPSGLLDTMTADEIRDLIAYLLSGDES
ncbi:PVC-type heme-binding CxxCH protein [Crateriforma conspicua]|uniref:PVC-type heme-binding CxxCH protein n=1 Tax=Crateriforma conspicua TaxID=2527996 RepID=UPI00118A4F90|nr:PVC-type heme-binding CxxCH protein [Crateriforma conspicua]QDV64009.1 Cytochrome c [Crateriforma conspicua]